MVPFHIFYLEDFETATETMRSRPELEVEYREWSNGILLARKIAA